MTDDLVNIMLELKEINKKLSNSYSEMWKQAKEYSACERDYKISLHQQILKLKADGHPVTLILELAKGTEHIANLRFKRDVADRKYETCKESIRSLRSIASVYQSILRVQDDV